MSTSVRVDPIDPLMGRKCAFSGRIVTMDRARSG
jgi:hypothetical protein